MNDALQFAGLVVSLGGAIGAVTAAVVETRNSRKLDDLDSKVDILSGRVDERGKTLQIVMGARLNTP